MMSIVLAIQIMGTISGFSKLDLVTFFMTKWDWLLKTLPHIQPACKPTKIQPPKPYFMTYICAMQHCTNFTLVETLNICHILA